MKSRRAKRQNELYRPSSAAPYSPVAAHKVFKSTQMWRESVLESAASSPDSCPVHSLLPKDILPIKQLPRKSDPGMLGSRKAMKEALLVEEGLSVHWGNYNLKSAVSASPLAVSFTKQLQERRKKTQTQPLLHIISPACLT